MSTQATYPSADATAQAQPMPEKSGCGCFVWGCLITVLVLAIVGGAIAYFTWTFYTGMIESMTDDKPVEIPVVELEERQMDELTKRLDQFKAAIEAEPELGEGGPDGEDAAAPDSDGTTDVATPDEAAQKETETKPGGDPAAVDGPTELILTADEINGLIANQDALRGKLFVRIENGEVTGDVSFKIDEIPGVENLPGIEGRFFNASVTLDVSLENGSLIVQAVDAEVKGKPVPEDFMKGMRDQNLAKDAVKDVKTAKMMRKIESIEVKDDKIVVKLRVPELEPASETE